MYTSIKAALMNGTDTLDVDAVVLIGEHGDYPSDELGRHMCASPPPPPPPSPPPPQAHTHTHISTH